MTTPAAIHARINKEIDMAKKPIDYEARKNRFYGPIKENKDDLTKQYFTGRGPGPKKANQTKPKPMGR